METKCTLKMGPSIRSAFEQDGGELRSGVKGLDEAEHWESLFCFFRDELFVGDFAVLLDAIDNVGTKVIDAWEKHCVEKAASGQYINEGNLDSEAGQESDESADDSESGSEALHKVEAESLEQMHDFSLEFDTECNTASRQEYWRGLALSLQKDHFVAAFVDALTLAEHHQTEFLAEWNGNGKPRSESLEGEDCSDGLVRPEVAPLSLTESGLSSRCGREELGLLFPHCTATNSP